MKKGDSMIVERAMELWRASAYEIAATDFCSPAEKREIYNELNARIGSGMSRCFFWGGCRGAERGVTVFLPEWYLPADAPAHHMPLDEARTDAFAAFLCENPDVLAEIPVTALSVKGSGFRELGHRDFMGGILSLGVDRSVIGDIAVLSPSEALVFAHKKIAPYLVSELTRIGRDAVRVEEARIAPDFVLPRRFEEIPVVVSSPRLDGVVKALCGKSREAAAEMVREGLCEVNYAVCTDVSKELSAGDVLSVRGVGKFVVGEVTGSTKSGRLRMACRKYV
ncbi:MAG: hypothetical protein II557_06690 [Clostridia bacterium]|nr:hypothetical protein [Clostridia bacterium]